MLDYIGRGFLVVICPFFIRGWFLYILGTYGGIVMDRYGHEYVDETASLDTFRQRIYKHKYFEQFSTETYVLFIFSCSLIEVHCVL